MKKVIVKSKAFLVCMCMTLMLCSVLLVGCGGKKFELVSATLAESEYTQDYVFINNEAAYELAGERTLRYILDITLKDSKGNETKASLDLSRDYDFASGETLKAWIDIDDGNGKGLSDRFLDMEITGYDDASVGDKTLTVRLGGNSESAVTSGEAELEIPYTVFHALKKCEVKEDRKEDYVIGEELDLPMILTYEDDSTEEVSFEKLMTMRAYNDDTDVSGFDSSKAGKHKPLTVRYNTSQTGHGSYVIYYNVMPDPNVWTQEKVVGGFSTYTFYKTENMTVGSETRKSVPFKTVSFGDAKIIMAVGGGYIIRPSATTFQNAMNKTENGSILNAIVPAGQKATVKSSENKDKYYKVIYTLSESSDKENVMYFVVSEKGQSMIAVVIEDMGSLNAEDSALAEQFAELVWFN